MNKKVTKTSSANPNVTSSPSSEADFNDTIAKNRALLLLDPDLVPAPPRGFVATNVSIRSRRLRRLSDELRAEAEDALTEASTLDLSTLLGKRAPDPARAVALAERMTQSANLVARAERLVRYASEADEIVVNDAIVYLEAIRGEYEHEAKHDPNVVQHFSALRRLFESRSAAISKGMARAAERAASEEEATEFETE